MSPCLTVLSILVAIVDSSWTQFDRPVLATESFVRCSLHPLIRAENRPAGMQLQQVVFRFNVQGPGVDEAE